MLKLFDKCPACGGPIIISECKCENCNLVMRGEFQPGPFSILSEDQLTFVRVFLRARGNLSEMEKVLGVSYPTIRNKLEEINTALDHAETAPENNSSKSAGGDASPAAQSDDLRRAILQQVSVGSLSMKEALQQLKGLQGGK
ncbi:MAG: DUF2089 domain-containing protein [Anaerolineaceae bacterium]|nr:DUF2089 domain-containing protein [Anaerolineaceae bacterium]